MCWGSCRRVWQASSRDTLWWMTGLKKKYSWSSMISYESLSLIVVQITISEELQLWVKELQNFRLCALFPNRPLLKCDTSSVALFTYQKFTSHWVHFDIKRENQISETDLGVITAMLSRSRAFHTINLPLYAKKVRLKRSFSPCLRLSPP